MIEVVSLLNTARLVVGVALGVLAMRCAVAVVQDWRPGWERCVFAALLIALVGYIARFAELWNEPLHLSGLPAAAATCLLLSFGWWLRYREPA